MGGMVESSIADGAAVKDYLPKRKPWWKDATLIKLNTLLLCALLTQTASGFDSSMLNGMQSLPHWQSYFGKPVLFFPLPS